MGSGEAGYSSDRSSSDSVLTTCPFCSCGCGLTLFHDSIHTTGTSPSLSHPVSQGRICARGWGAHEPSAWGQRLLRPSLRDGQGIRPVPWAEAVDRGARELRGLLDQGKRVGVLASGRGTNEEAYLAVKLARGALQTGNLDAFLREPYQALLEGLDGRGRALDLCGALTRVEESHRILLLEGNLAVSHPHVAFSVLRALRRGARLVTLGRARTQMSRVATDHLPLGFPSPHRLPGGLTEALGLEKGSGGKGLSVILAPFTRDAEAVFQTALSLVETLVASQGGNGSGPCFLPLPHRANTRGALEMGATPGHLPGLRSLTDPGARERIRSVWGIDPALEDGLDAERMLQEVQGLVVLREHPPSSASAPVMAGHALEKLESLIVLDAYRSPTSDAATVVLPLAAMAEEEGTLTSMEGRVQRLRRAVAPPGLARPGWQVLADLLISSGLGSGYRTPDEVFGEMGTAIPEYGALAPELLDVPGGGWVPTLFPPTRGPAGPTGPAGRGTETGNGTHWLALDGSFDWEDDLLVGLSPNLRRDGASRRKLHPGGMVAMNPSDAQALGVRAGWSVRLRSPVGEALIPVTMSAGVEAGTLLAPFGFREALASVLGGETVRRVEVERA